MLARRFQDNPKDPEDIGIVQRLHPDGRVTPLEMQRVVNTITREDVPYHDQLVIEGRNSPIVIYTDEPFTASVFSRISSVMLLQTACWESQLSAVLSS